MLVGSEGNIYIQRHHPAYAYVIDFLVSCCEPVSRTQHMEQYILNADSLSAATAEGTYTTAMMETFLRYWQLDPTTQSPFLDLDKVKALYDMASPSSSSVSPSARLLLLGATSSVMSDEEEDVGAGGGRGVVRSSALEERGREQSVWDRWRRDIVRRWWTPKQRFDRNDNNNDKKEEEEGRSRDIRGNATTPAEEREITTTTTTTTTTTAAVTIKTEKEEGEKDTAMNADEKMPLVLQKARLKELLKKNFFVSTPAENTNNNNNNNNNNTVECSTTTRTSNAGTASLSSSSTAQSGGDAGKGVVDATLNAHLPPVESLPMIHYALAAPYTCSIMHENLLKREENTPTTIITTTADNATNNTSHGVFIPPLPRAVEAMLHEEDRSSKMEVVLQPRGHQQRSGGGGGVSFLQKAIHNNNNNANNNDWPSIVGNHEEEEENDGGGLANTRVGGVKNPPASGEERTRTLKSTPPPHPHPHDASHSSALAYYLVSKDKALLEHVVETGLKEYIAPTWLGGTARFIISDVRGSISKRSRGGGGGIGGSSSVSGNARSHRDGGGETGGGHQRAVILERLYLPVEISTRPTTTTTTTTANNNNNNNSSTIASASTTTTTIKTKTKFSSSSSSWLEYKSEIRRGAVRQVREVLFKQFGIRADCCYDYLADEAAEEAATPSSPSSSFHIPRLELCSGVRLRPYQVASLDRFRRGHVAHQGVVVLPCGAGKTLTGIAAAATIKKRTIVMCVNHMSVFQWQREFLRWTNLLPSEVTVCTSKVKQMPGPVFITTYNMIVKKREEARSGGAAAAQGTDAQRSEEILRAVGEETWGLLLLDEVHTALAHNFQEVVNKIQFKCVLGLSATLLREDNRITDLRHLVGPKLYEANWLDLTRAGFLANVECAEIQCPLPHVFWQRYIDAAGEPIMEPPVSPAQRQRRRRRRRRRFYTEESSEDSSSDVSDDGDETSSGSSSGSDSGAASEDGTKRPTTGKNKRGRRRRRRGGGRTGPHFMGGLTQAIASCNPIKLWCAEALLHFHLKERSPPDKVIIFCDYLLDAHFYAHRLHIPLMEQSTSEAERRHLLQWFQYSQEVNALILTRVGDVALDIPNASVIIQISGLMGSRRQEAQRLGRILRPKPPSLDHHCAYFYSLVSQDTHEIRTSYARQSWLRDQGFAYRVLTADNVLRWYYYGADGSEDGDDGSPVASAKTTTTSNNSTNPRGGHRKRASCCIGRPQWWYSLTANEWATVQQSVNQQQSSPSLSASATTTRRGDISRRSSVMDMDGNGPTPQVRRHGGAIWAPFTAADSIKIQTAFNAGVESVVCSDGLPLLKEAMGQQRTPRQRAAGEVGEEAAGVGGEWEVRFSSVDAPNTFGTVQRSHTAAPASSTSSILMRSTNAVKEEEEEDGENDNNSRHRRTDSSGVAVRSSLLSSRGLVRRVTHGPLDSTHCCLDEGNEECCDFALQVIKTATESSSTSLLSKGHRLL